ncbi:MAG: ABC transporter substrate-binding protein [Deltaproteobacteria bacterium]|nr:ABC transporter substrate-binding protein [Deltaproteobacteria bacterium]
MSYHPFVIFASLLLFLSLFGVPETSESQESPRLTVAYSSRSIAPIDYFLAEHFGYFKAENLDVRLVQIRASVAIAATLAGDVDVLGSITSAISAIQKGAPIKVLAVTLYRPLFWLVARPEFKNTSELKGRVLGVVSIGGAQHTALRHMLRKGGVDPDTEVTTILAGDVPTQLQALASNSIQAAALSPPTVIVARDRFKMNILSSVMEDYPTIQNGVAVPERALVERRRSIQAILRARARASRLFHENPQAPIEVISRILHVDQQTARETYLLSKKAFTQNGIVSEKEALDYLKSDAERLKLKEPVPISQAFDFSLQREVNQEIGIKAR